MKCGMCGRRFHDQEAIQTCTSCPIVSNCGLVRCPYCGYEMPPEPKLVQWLKEAVGNRRSELSEVPAEFGPQMSLAKLGCGQCCRVVGVRADNGSGNHLMKLMAMGIYPGAQLQLIRRSPAVVYQCGYSQFAIDTELAECVTVRVEPSMEVEP